MRYLNLRIFLVFLLWVCLLPSFSPVNAAPGLIQAGPMIGHVSEATAKVWIRTKRGATIDAQATQGAREFGLVRIEDLESDFSILHFDGLQPATKTRVLLTVSRSGSEPESARVTFKTAPIPSQTGTVRVAFGSCSKISQFGEGLVYQAIADERPDMAIFVGDNSYFIVGDGSTDHYATSGPFGDWISPEGMLARHFITRVNHDLQRMFRTVPSYAVWDDHDYGPNNADREFELREEATRAFVQYWANPSYGTPTLPGIFSAFRHGPVEVFLLDDRYYKYSPQVHDDVTQETGVIWGQGQMEWLLAGLKASTAPVKLLANGTQFLSKTDVGEGHWQEARAEQNQLLNFIAEHRIGGVVFLTGDRHYSEANQQRQPDGTLVVECTSSPLQQDQKVEPQTTRNHENRIWGMHGNSFGLVTVNITAPNQGTITFEARDEYNQIPVFDGKPCRTVWDLNALNYTGEATK